MATEIPIFISRNGNIRIAQGGVHFCIVPYLVRLFCHGACVCHFFTPTLIITASLSFTVDAGFVSHENVFAELELRNVKRSGCQIAIQNSTRTEITERMACYRASRYIFEMT